MLLSGCAVIGVTAGISPKYGLVAVLGLAYVVITFSDLVLGIAIFTAMSFLDVLGVGAAVSFDKVAGLLLVLSWLLRQATAPRRGTRDMVARHPWLFVWIVAFLAWEVMSALWATDKGWAVSIAYRDGMLLTLTPIVYNAVRTRRDLRTIIIGYLVGAGFSSIYGILNPPPATAAAAGRLVGSLGEANQSATVLVAALALCAGLALVARHSPRTKLLILCIAALSVIGLIGTLSRAGLIAFAVVLVCAMFIGGRWRRRAVVAVVAGAVALPAYFLVLAPPSALNRVTMDNSDGRNDIWRVAWRVFSASPLLGSGAGNFEYVSAKYLQRPGLVNAANFIVTPKVVHNIYLEQLADVGVPGLVTMLGIFVCGIGASLRAAHIFERIGDWELELVARSTILALIAFLAADFFASELISKQLWLVFALGPALLKLADIERGRLRV